MVALDTAQRRRRCYPRTGEPCRDVRIVGKFRWEMIHMKVIRLKHVIVLGIGSLVWACGGDNIGPEGPLTVTSVTPSTGTVGTELRITGTGFVAGAQVLLDGLSATGVDVTSSTEVFASVPSGVVANQVYDVTVRNAGGGEVTFAAAFTAVAPTLQFVNSATKPSGNTGSTVIIEGEAFGDAQGPGQVLFSDGAGGTLPATIVAADDWTDTFIVTTVPSSAADGPVVVQTGTGNSNSLPFTIMQNATFSPSTIAWAETQALPAALSGHDALFVPIDNAGGQTVQYVYVSGGASNNDDPRSNIDFSVIQNDGSLSGWTAGTALPVAQAFHAMVAATQFNSKVKASGHLYIIGGIEAAGGQPVTTVSTAQFNSDGTMGAMGSAQALPVPLHSLGAVIFRSAIYVVGGATTDNVPVATVYRSRIDTLGNLGAWEQMTPLPEIRAYHSAQQFGGFLYAVGGDSGTVAPNDAGFQQNTTKIGEVLFAKIDLRTGDLATSWTANASEMQKARSKHSALAAGGNMFVTAGLYAAAGTGSSENIFAQINSDGTLSSFNGATGSNTLESLGGVNLFNHAAIGYVDASGVAHVMILGGDDVSNQGTRRANVYFY